MLIEYSGAQCGSGKTTSLLTELATKPGRYLYAVDRRDVIPARRQMIVDAAQAAGLPVPLVVEIISEDDEAKVGTETVPTRIADIPADYSALSHVVAIITHAGMTLADFRSEAFGDWEIVVDEDPTLFSHDDVRSGVSGMILSQFFGLEPVAGIDGLHRITVLPGAPSVNDFRSDTWLKGMTEFRRQVEHRDVLTREADWTDVIAGKAWSYFSLWPLTSLASFKRVRIVANAFDERLNYRLASSLYPDQITFKPFPLAVTTPPMWLPRNVVIHYFTDEHRAGSTFFATAEGKRYRDEAARWIAAQPWATAGQHYWSANIGYAPAKDVTIAGERVSPRVAGRNDLRHCNAVSVLYSAKASQSEAAAINLLTGSGKGASIVERDREIEDLVQIVLRSSLRDPGNGQDVTVTVYDKWQAEALQGFLERSGYGCGGRVLLVPVDLGTVKRTRKPVGRPRLPEGRAQTGSERSQKSRRLAAAAKAGATAPIALSR